METEEIGKKEDYIQLKNEAFTCTSSKQYTVE